MNVSRQIVSAWENGKKDIPKERKEQLANYFGINAQYFDEINEMQKKENPVIIWTIKFLPLIEELDIMNIVLKTIKSYMNSHLATKWVIIIGH